MSQKSAPRTTGAASTKSSNQAPKSATQDKPDTDRASLEEWREGSKDEATELVNYARDLNNSALRVDDEEDFYENGSELRFVNKTIEDGAFNQKPAADVNPRLKQWYEHWNSVQGYPI